MHDLADIAKKTLRIFNMLQDIKAGDDIIGTIRHFHFPEHPIDYLQPLQLGVEALELDPRRAWRVKLDNGLTVDVGRNHPANRIARFVRVYPSILAGGNGRVESVDLRYSNGFAVRWQQLDTEAESTG